MGKSRGVYKFCGKKPEGKNHLEDLDMEGRTILEWILKERIRKRWAGLI